MSRNADPLIKLQCAFLICTGERAYRRSFGISTLHDQRMPERLRSLAYCRHRQHAVSRHW
jgi:hypothetical protein